MSTFQPARSVLAAAIVASHIALPEIGAVAAEQNAAALYAERCGVCHSGAPAKFLGAKVTWKSGALVLKDDDTSLRDFFNRHGRLSSDEADLLTTYAEGLLKAK